MGNNDILKKMIGKTIVEIKKGYDKLSFTANDGSVMKLLHYQECCESVEIEDICGDLSDLLHTPLLLAEEISDADFPPKSDCYESYTWTFYKFATIKGSVDVRFYGESNGYYSEGVSVEFIEGEKQ